MNAGAHKQGQNHIAIDIGASSGRVVCGTLQEPEGTLSLTEIHRFSNGFSEKNGNLYWDVDYLFAEIVKGLQKAKSKGIEHCTVGIDTWAVDYVLLDQKGTRIHEVFLIVIPEQMERYKAYTAIYQLKAFTKRRGYKFSRLIRCTSCLCMIRQILKQHIQSCWSLIISTIGLRDEELVKSRMLQPRVC